MGVLLSAEKSLNDLRSTIQSPLKQKPRPSSTRPDDYPEGFIFAEVETSGVTSKTNLVQLAGTDMIHKPFENGSKLRVEKEFYPGNLEPNVQVMGFEDKDFTVKGRFHSKKYKDQSFYAIPKLRAEQIRALQKRAKLLKVSLGEWIRYCFLAECRFKENTKGDIEYELDFMNCGESIPKSYYQLADTKEKPFALNTTLIAAATAFQTKYTNLPGTIDQTIASRLNVFIGEVATTIATATKFVDAIVTTAEQIFDSLNKAIGLIKVARASISVFSRRLGALSYNIGNLTGTQKRYQTISTVQNAIHDVQGLASYLSQIQAQLEAIRRTIPRARHLVHEGDILEKISMKYYRTADNADLIRTHNKLTSTVLVRGTVLEIPNV